MTLLAESFGGCLALRLAAAAPHLIKSLVLLNPATCYNQSLNGLSSFVSATNLLGLFPQDLYNTAQVGVGVYVWVGGGEWLWCVWWQSTTCRGNHRVS